MAAYSVLFLRSTAEWFAFMFLVYFAIASSAYRLLWVRHRDRFQHKRIQRRPSHGPDPLKELSLSVATLLMLAILVGAMHVLTELGWAKFYYDLGSHGMAYFCASFLIIAVSHDTYYYWAHRAMHAKLLFRRVHRLHHQFVNPTPFASFAFHPLEAVIEIGIVGLLLLTIPLHPLVLAVYYVIHTFLNVISHLGFEFYPAWVSRWFITSTHHNLHHTRFSGHYMLYFNVWDRLMCTNYRDYHALCQSFAAAKPLPGNQQRDGRNPRPGLASQGRPAEDGILSV